MRLILPLALALTLAGCATSNGDPRDPWEGLNRKTFAFNDTLDKAVIAELSKAPAERNKDKEQALRDQLEAKKTVAQVAEVMELLRQEYEGVKFDAQEKAECAIERLGAEQAAMAAFVHQHKSAQGKQADEQHRGCGEPVGNVDTRDGGPPKKRKRRQRR